jgi:hypothetical protein
MALLMAIMWTIGALALICIFDKLTLWLPYRDQNPMITTNATVF